MDEKEMCLRVGLLAIIGGKIGMVSPRPGTGNVHPKDWVDYKEPVWDFIPMKPILTKYNCDGWWE